MKLKMDNITIKGHKGTWYLISNREYHIPCNDGGRTKPITLYLLEHEIYGEDTTHIIAIYNEDYERYDVILDTEIFNGFADLDEFETCIDGIWYDKNDLIQARLLVNNL